MKKHTKVVLSRIVASALVVGAMFSNVIADPALDTAPAAVEEVADSVVTPPSKFGRFAKNVEQHRCRRRFRWVVQLFKFYRGQIKAITAYYTL